MTSRPVSKRACEPRSPSLCNHTGFRGSHALLALEDSTTTQATLPPWLPSPLASHHSAEARRPSSPKHLLTLRYDHGQKTPRPSSYTTRTKSKNDSSSKQTPPPPLGHWLRKTTLQSRDVGYVLRIPPKTPQRPHHGEIPAHVH